MSASGSAMIAPPAGKGEMPGMWEWGFLNACACAPVHPPHVAHNEFLMSASGSAMSVPPAGKGGMPGMWEFM